MEPSGDGGLAAEHPAQRRRVLHVINSLGISGGAERQLMANLGRFRDGSLEHSVAVLYRASFANREHELPANRDVTYLSAVDEKPPLPVLYRRLSQLVHLRQPDLLHATLYPSNLLSRLVSRRRAVPVTESLVNISHERARTVDSLTVTPVKLSLYRLIDKATISTTTRFHALSEAVAASWQRVVGLDPSLIDVIPRGVDLARIEAIQESLDRHAYRGTLGVGANETFILAVGRHEPQKGLGYLIEAMHALGEPSLELKIAGREASLTLTLRRMASAGSARDQIEFLGRRDDIYEMMAAADMFVFPSLYEGLGVSLIEAMASGLPIVTTDSPPMNSVIDHRRTGLLVPPQDAKAIAQAISLLHDDPAMSEQLGRNARNDASDRFRLDVTAERFEDFLRRAVL